MTGKYGFEPLDDALIRALLTIIKDKSCAEQQHLSAD